MFYIQQDNKILLFDEDKQRLQNTIDFTMPQYQGLEIKEVEEGYVIYNFELMTVEEKEEKEAQKERELLDKLSMTRSDFFDGMIMAFGLDSKELRVIIGKVLGSINITPVQIRVALNNYDNALNFYRKHTLFTLINNVQIPIDETMYLLFTDDIWNKFFKTKDYTELQNAIHEIEPELVNNEELDV